MDRFIDPRESPSPSGQRALRRVTSDPAAVVELRALCREGRIYETERWIRDGRPLQLDPAAVPKGRHLETPLEVAIDRGNHGLVLVLLCNGYDPNLDKRSPLERAVERRDWPIVDLLWAWGADPKRVSPYDILSSYDSAVFERFYTAGLDLTEGHEMAAILGMGTSNRALYGFARKHRQHEPKIQRELNMALVEQVERDNVRGVALCLWAGADPHAGAPSLHVPHVFDEEDAEDEDGEDRFVGWSAIQKAAILGRIEVLKRLGPDPTRDDFEAMYQWTGSPATIDCLAAMAPPTKVGAILRSQLFYLRVKFPNHHDSLGVIEALFKSGARWTETDPAQLGDVRRELLKADDFDFTRVMQLLGVRDHCSPDILRELARTPGMRDRMRNVGLVPWEEPDRKRRSYNFYHPPHAREIARNCGFVPPVVPAPVPKAVVIRRPQASSARLSMSREALYEKVWAEPVDKLAKEWGLSGRGLGKLCARMMVPVPPRGYWAQVQNGKRVRKAPLPVIATPPR